jgi:hypothetical protein
MYPDNNSNLNVSFDQESISNAARVYVIDEKKKSFLAKFLVDRGLFSEENTASIVLIVFATIFFLVSVFVLYESLKYKPLNMVTAKKPTVNQVKNN